MNNRWQGVLPEGFQRRGKSLGDWIDQRYSHRLSKLPAWRRMGVFLLTLALLGLPVVLVLSWWVRGPVQIGALRIQDAPQIFPFVALYGIFIVLLRWWGKRVHGAANPLEYYGWVWSKLQWRRLVAGLIVGYTFVLLMYLVQSFLGWVVWQEPGRSILPLIFEGAVMALFIGAVEELLFRGWMLGELRRDYGPRLAFFVDSGIFALLHCLRPWYETGQGFALFLLGVVLCLARLAGGGLAYGIGIHSGLVWLNYVLTVGGLVRATERVPDWVTGIDRNPLAGLLGVGMMATIALWVGIDAVSQPQGRSPGQSKSNCKS
jgi:uncharacterized protein